MRQIYLDYNATTPMTASVFEAMEPFLKNHYGNASSLHHASREPRRVIREARRNVASLLGAADENSIVFTSGGTESNTAALRSALRTSGKRRIVSCTVEHSSILKPLLQMEKEGIKIVRLPVGRDGQLDLDEMRRALTSETALVSLMSANNETGILLPVEKAGAIIKECGILFHVDAVQSVGKQPFNLKHSPIDFLSLSGHKLYGPKGIGALYIKPDVPFEPLIAGGSQERGRRGGTENVPGIAGLGRACDAVKNDLAEESFRLKGLRDSFEERLCIENEGVEIVGRKVSRLPNTTLALFRGVEAETLLYALDAQGIACSSGSACMSGSSEPSHVLTAMGYDKVQALSAIRFSLGKFTHFEELFETLTVIRGLLTRLRGRSK